MSEPQENSRLDDLQFRREQIAARMNRSPDEIDVVPSRRYLEDTALLLKIIEQQRAQLAALREAASRVENAQATVRDDDAYDLYSLVDEAIEPARAALEQSGREASE
jgi:hypothetical protein